MKYAVHAAALQVDTLLEPEHLHLVQDITRYMGRPLLRRGAGSGPMLERALAAPSQHQTVAVSATLLPATLRRLQVWCPGAVLVTEAGVVAQQPAALLQPGVALAAQAGVQQDMQHASQETRLLHPADAAKHERLADDIGLTDADEEALHPLLSALPRQLRHYYVPCAKARRVAPLLQCIRALRARRLLVYHPFPHRLRSLCGALKGRGLAVGQLDVSMDSAERRAVVQDLGSGRLQVGMHGNLRFAWQALHGRHCMAGTAGGRCMAGCAGRLLVHVQGWRVPCARESPLA